MRKGNPTANLPFDFLTQTRDRWLSLKDLPNICMYCGDPAYEAEHVIPYWYVGNNTPMVWACSECNGIAGGRLFDDLFDKSRFINEKLKIKYQNILDIPLWGADEIGELDDRLNQYVKGMREVQKWIRGRVAWKVNPDVLCVMKCLMELNDQDDSIPLFAEKSGVNITGLRRLIAFESKIILETDLSILQNFKPKNPLLTRDKLIKCVSCGKEFTTTRKRKFCDLSCKQKLQREYNLSIKKPS